MHTSKHHMSEIKTILQHDVFPLICPIAFKNSAENTPRAVMLPQAWTLSGPFAASEKVQYNSVCGMSKDEELTAVVKQSWDLKDYGTVVSVDN